MQKSKVMKIYQFEKTTFLNKYKNINDLSNMFYKQVSIHKSL